MPLEIPIVKIEFHEKKSRNLLMPYIETQFHVNDILEFLKWCDEDKEVMEWALDWIGTQIMKMKTWKRPTPKFDQLFKGKTIYIYPKQKIVAVAECGIHYICQHSFDILPRFMRESIYGYNDKPFEVGMLYPMESRRHTSKPVMVKNSDIHEGFMLHRKTLNEYNDDFVFWVKTRRELDEARKNKPESHTSK